MAVYAVICWIRLPITHQPINDATITILDARDSTLVNFSRSLSSGGFRIDGLKSGSYRLLITHVGYHAVARNFMIGVATRDPDLGRIVLSDKSSLLAEVTVEGVAAPVTIRHDTVEYNAGSFRVRPDAVVEDLLKKLPGIQVDRNGTIKANGEEVKKDRRNGLFGRLTALGGTDVKAEDTRYENKFNLNQFNGSRQLSVLGMANNTNKQGFSFQDVLGFTGGMGGPGNNCIGPGGSDPFGSGIPIQGMTDNNTAITTTLAGGLNFNDKWRRNTDLSGIPPLFSTIKGIGYRLIVN